MGVYCKRHAQMRLDRFERETAARIRVSGSI